MGVSLWSSYCVLWLLLAPFFWLLPMHMPVSDVRLKIINSFPLDSKRVSEQCYAQSVEAFWLVAEFTWC